MRRRARGKAKAPAPVDRTLRANIGEDCCHARRLATNGRFAAEPQEYPTIYPPRGFERNWAVQTNTGYATSIAAGGQWVRGYLYRSAMPVFALHSPGPMYDPTDPSTWRPEQ